MAKKRKAGAPAFHKTLFEAVTRLEGKVDDIRTKDIPAMNTRLGVMDAKLEERTGNKATVVSLIAALVSVAGALALMWFRN